MTIMPLAETDAGPADALMMALLEPGGISVSRRDHARSTFVADPVKVVRDEPASFKLALEGIASVAFENGQLAERVRRETLARTNLERYFTPSVAACIVNSEKEVRPGGDKRPVAVLFSDIRGFTAISEQMNPFQMAKLLSDYFSEMVDCVFRHGGTLDKFMGDALMAQWGAPTGQPDDVDRAFRAAVDMLCALDKLNARWSAEGRPTMQAGIGLNFGEAFAGNIGCERRLEYTVIGDTVNIASHLCSVAAAGEILLTESFEQALKAPTLMAPVPPLFLKGRTGAVPVFKVLR